MSAEQETLVQLQLEKLKAVHELEVAQKMRVQLLQTVSAAQLQQKTDEESHRVLIRATGLSEACKTKIEESRERIEQVKKVL